MPQIILSQVPQNIATLESLSAWSLLTLYDLYQAATYQELPGVEMTSLVSAMVGRSYDDTQRLICRASFQLHPEFATSTNKLWDDVLKFPGEPIIPARFLA